MKKPKSKQHGNLPEKEGLAKTKPEPQPAGPTTKGGIRIVNVTSKAGRAFVITGVRSPKQLAQERRNRGRAEQKSKRPKKSLREILHDAAFHLMSLLPELSSGASFNKRPAPKNTEQQSKPTLGQKQPSTTGGSETTTFKNIQIVFDTPKKKRQCFVITGVRSPRQLGQSQRPGRTPESERSA